MSHPITFGPANIFFNETCIGKTFGGGVITVLYETYSILSTNPESKKVPYGLEGSISLFNLNNTYTLDIIDANITSYGKVEIVLANGVITLFKSKLEFPNDITFGENVQTAITLQVTGTCNDANNILSLSPSLSSLSSNVQNMIQTGNGLYLNTL